MKVDKLKSKHNKRLRNNRLTLHHLELKKAYEKLPRENKKTLSRNLAALAALINKISVKEKMEICQAQPVQDPKVIV